MSWGSAVDERYWVSNFEVEVEVEVEDMARGGGLGVVEEKSERVCNNRRGDGERECWSRSPNEMQSVQVTCCDASHDACPLFGGEGHHRHWDCLEVQERAFLFGTSSLQ